MKSLPKLEKLKVQGCERVTDEAVPILVALPDLREVDLKGTAVTDKGLAALHALKPKVLVYCGPWDAKAANFRNN